MQEKPDGRTKAKRKDMNKDAKNKAGGEDQPADELEEVVEEKADELQDDEAVEKDLQDIPPAPDANMQPRLRITRQDLATY